MATESGPPDGPDQTTPKAKPAIPFLKTPSADTSRESSPSRTGARLPVSRVRTSRESSPVKNARAKTPAQAIPSIPPASESSGESTPRAGRRIGNDNVPRWPTRLKSPPPSTVHRSNVSPRRLADSSPNRDGTASPTASTAASIDSVTEEDDPHSSGRAPSRGVSGTGPTLETVPEAGSIATTLSRALSDSTLEEGNPVKMSENTRTLAHESGSESGENRDKHTDVTLKPLTTFPARKTENQNTSMTVETETVASIPQAPIGTVDRGGGRSDTGSLRMKSSRETIRPKKEKKKPPRKTTTVNTATGSTNADIFEAQIASAVDEANSTDSEETFVYESNPPEPVSNRSRMHSRTPSSNSMQVYLDQRGTGRTPNPRTDVTATGTAKKSMKFTQNPYNSTDVDSKDNDRLDPTRGTGRGGGTAGSHHHLHGQNGRQNRQGGAHKSLFAEDAPFYQSKRSNPPSSPRSGLRSSGTAASKKLSRFNTYDMEGEGADDERTPLMNRSKRRRPGSSTLRHFGLGSSRRRNCVARYLGCILVSFMFSIVLLGAVGFLYTTTRELEDVSVIKIKNVLASEQELIFDLMVEATNLNVMAVSIYNMEVNVFAKTKYLPSKGDGDKDSSSDPELSVFSRSSWEIEKKKRRAVIKRDNVDEGTDPEPGEKPSEIVPIGRVTEFDSPLTFEGTPFRRIPSVSTGEVQLHKPGNKTETGSEAWESVVKHSFELIIRGSFKYQLPLSSKVSSQTVSAHVIVHPDEGIVAPPHN